MSLVASRLPVGAAGEVVSMARATVEAGEVLPAGSVAVRVALPLVPWGRATVGRRLHEPSAATWVVSSSPVAGMRAVMVSPGVAPAPLRVGVVTLVRPSPRVPESLAGSSRAWGAAGGCASTVSLEDSPLCWLVAVTEVPLTSGVAGVRLQVPSAPATTEPSAVPVLVVSTTVLPGRAVPASNCPLVGRMKGTLALTVSESGALVLPAASSWVALSTVPSGCAAASVTRQVPSAATSVVPNTPAGLRSVSTAPGSPVPLTAAKPLVGAIAGASAVASTTSASEAAVLALPAGSVAVTATGWGPSASGSTGSVRPSGRAVAVSRLHAPLWASACTV